ncbi:MAG TPA: ROK family transcriptional regulator [Spirochaetia bacterium]|nr:ROK family transcriptional regulator [Spirochaetia bacterium]
MSTGISPTSDTAGRSRVGLREQVLGLLQERRELTKPEISAALGKSIPAVTAHLRALVHEGYVEESGSAGSTGGRRPVILRFRPRARYLLAADVRPGQLRTVLTDLDTRVLREEAVRLGGKSSAQQMIVRLVEAFRAVMPTGADRERVVGAGLSLPGTVHPEQLLMEFAPNLRLRNLNFGALEVELGIPIRLENEANAAALAEFYLGRYRGVRHLIYVSVIQGIGVGIILNGSLYRGAHGNAGEFGHMTYVPGGRRCSCGRRGCWERYASERALPDEYRESGGTGTVHSFVDLKRRIDRGDRAAVSALQTIIGNLATGVGSLAAGFDPDLLLVGGGIVGLNDMVISGIRERLPGCPVELASLGENAALKGAALLPRSAVGI